MRAAEAAFAADSVVAVAQLRQPPGIDPVALTALGMLAPDAWAMYVHQQRFADDYRDALKFPLALHLAELATDYALPHDYEVLADAQGASDSDGDAEAEEADGEEAA